MVNQAAINDFKVFYWRDKNNEVDFVLVKRQKKIAIEVKTGRRIMNEDLSKFAEAYKPHRSIVVGSAAYPPKNFFLSTWKCFSDNGILPVRMFDRLNFHKNRPKMIDFEPI